MNPIKPTFKTEIFSWLIIILVAAASFYFYAHFPESVPTHWNFAGEANGWSSKGLAAFLFPVIILGMYFLFLFIPFFDPKKERYEEFRNIYNYLRFGFILFMSAVYFIAGFSALGYGVPVGTLIPLLAGLLFIFIGSVMGKIKQNWFIGIRTPWSLSSEEVWKKTQQVGGRFFIIGGILIAIEPFLPASFRAPLFIISISLMVLGTIGYSYYAYFQEKKGK